MSPLAVKWTICLTNNFRYFHQALLTAFLLFQSHGFLKSSFFIFDTRYLVCTPQSGMWHLHSAAQLFQQRWALSGLLLLNYFDRPILVSCIPSFSLNIIQKKLVVQNICHPLSFFPPCMSSFFFLGFNSFGSSMGINRVNIFGVYPILKAVVEVSTWIIPLYDWINQECSYK